MARFDEFSLIRQIFDIDLAGNRTVSSLQFDMNIVDAGFTLDTAVSSHQLTLNSGAISVGGGFHTIYSDIVLGANAVWSVGTFGSLAVNGAISGTANLTLTGGGTLELGGANAYTGSTVISAGTLRLDANNVIPDPSAVTLTGTLALNGQAESIHSLTGTGDLNLQDGTLTILNTSSFDGEMNVAGAGDSTIVVPSGVTYTHNDVGSGAPNDIANLNPDTVRLIFDVDGAAVIEVPINTGQGTGDLVKRGTGSLSLLSNTSRYGGRTVVENGTLITHSVTPAVLGNASGIGNGYNDSTLIVGGPHTPGTFEFAGTTAVGTMDRAVFLGAGGGVFDISLASETLTLTGVIGDVVNPSPLTKAGPGTLQLSGANTYSGGSTVNEGTLQITNTTGSGTGTGQVAVNSGATLAGTGSIDGPLQVNAGGLVSPGTSIGTLTVNNDAGLHGMYLCEIDGAAADRITASGSLDLAQCTIELGVLSPPTEPLYIIASGASITNTHANEIDLPAGYVVAYDDNKVLLMQPLPVFGGSSLTIPADSPTVWTDAWSLGSIIPGTTSWTLRSNSNSDLVTTSIDPATGKVTLTFTSTLANDSATLVFRGYNAAGQFGDWTITVTTRSPIHVDLSATGANDGSSWTDAYTDLQSALSAATDGDRIWVAKGRYLPGNTRDATFQLVNGVKIYGGFSGVEFRSKQRDPVAHPTILSGDVDENDTGTDGIARTPAEVVGGNAYHVVTAGSGLLPTAVLDGFIITAGKADGGLSSQQSGAGLHSISTRIVVANCRFMGNQASWGGGALYLEGKSGFPDFINCTFSGNQADEGGAISMEAAFGAFTNCRISGNLVDGDGGGVAIFNTSIGAFYSCTVSGNKSNFSLGGGFSVIDSTLEAVNTIVWGNAGGTSPSLNKSGTGDLYINYSLFQGMALGGTNFDGTTNPSFISPVNMAALPTSDGDLRLAAGSALIDQGEASELGGDGADLDRDNVTTETLPRDLALFSRVMGAGLDPGAYETRPILHVDADVSGGTGDGSSWANAFPFLQDALDAAGPGAEIRVAGGTYHPDDGASVTANDPAAVFRMADDVALYGGYAGSGMPSPDDRDPDTWPSILSGDLADDDGALPVGTNSSHVVAAESVDNTAILDGFTVSGGVNFVGSALVCFFDSAPRISNCRFTGNHSTEDVNVNDPLFANFESFPTTGEGFYIGVGGCVVSIHNFGEAIGNETYAPGLVGPLITDCIFSGNSSRISTEGYWAPVGIGLAVTTVDGCEILDNDATLAGEGGDGGISLLVSNTNVLRCRISGNTGGTGGVYVVENGPSVIANTLISGNTGWIGGMGVEGGSGLRLINSTVAGNAGQSSGGIVADLSSSDELVMDNCLVWANGAGSSGIAASSLDANNQLPIMNNCYVDHQVGGTHAAADLFVAPEAPASAPTTGGDYRLAASSPAIDDGNTAILSLPDGRFLGVGTDVFGAVDTSGATDLAGSARLFGDDIDVGAYESSSVSAIGITPALLGPTNADSVEFTVTFNQPVLGFNALSDLELITTGTATATGASFSGSGDAYTVTLTGVSGDGPLALKVSTTSDVTDAFGNPLDSSVTSAAVTIDNTPPTAFLIVPATTGPTNATSLSFTVYFSEFVTGFDSPSDLNLVITGTANASGGSIEQVMGTYSVTITGVSGDGTLALEVGTHNDVTDAAGNAIASSVLSPAVTVDHTGPSAVAVTPVSTTEFNVLFDEPVTGFDSFSDLDITTTGTVAVTGATFSGSGDSYTVTLTGVTGDGTLSLAVGGASDVEDALGHPLDDSVVGGPVGIGNVAPYVVSITPSTTGPIPANERVQFTAVFSEPVTGFNSPLDLLFTTTNVNPNGLSQLQTSDRITYTFEVSVLMVDGETTGSLRLRFNNASDIMNLAGNPLVGSTASPAVQFTPTAYQAWAIANGLTPGVNFHYHQDADGDGLSNAAEYFRNLNPIVQDSGQTRQLFHVEEIGGQRYGVLTLACRTDVPYQVVYDGWIAANHSILPYLVIEASDNIRASADLQFGGPGNPAIIQDTTLPIPAGLPTLDPGWEWYHFRFVEPVATLGSGFMRWQYVNED